MKGDLAESPATNMAHHKEMIRLPNREDLAAAAPRTPAAARGRCNIAPGTDGHSRSVETGYAAMTSPIREIDAGVDWAISQHAVDKTLTTAVR